MPFIEHEGRRFLFIHVPKTGGTTIERWLAEIAPLAFRCTDIPNCARITPQHYTHNDISACFPPGWFDFKFTVVRNPFARIESEYRMRHLLATSGPIGNFAPFGQWLERTLDQYRSNPWVLDNHIRPQVQFLGEGVHLYRLEEGMDTILRRVCAASGLPQPAGGREREMSSASFTGEVRWTEYEVGLVQEFYARDFARFGYSTDVADRHGDGSGGA